jgi:hypothetical protein
MIASWQLRLAARPAVEVKPSDFELAMIILIESRHPGFTPEHW